MIVQVNTPTPVHGTYSIFVYSPLGSPATLRNTHFIDDDYSWCDVLSGGELSGNQHVQTTIATLAGHVKLSSDDPDAKASLVEVKN